MRYLSLMQDNPNLTPPAKQRLEVALVVLSGTASDGEIGIREMEGGLYATARIYVPIEEYAAQWESLVADWLPGSGYQPDHRRNGILLEQPGDRSGTPLRCGDLPSGTAALSSERSQPPRTGDSVPTVGKQDIEDRSLRWANV